MKIIIYHHYDFIDAIPADVQVVSSERTIKNLIANITTQEDIEGEIHPSAKNNPEFFAILRAIYDHKVNLWNSLAGIDPPGPPFHEKFANIIYDKYRIVVMP